jgi:hypothetical protein
MRICYGACSQKLDPDQVQVALQEVAQSLGTAHAMVDSKPRLTEGDRPTQTDAAQSWRPAGASVAGRGSDRCRRQALPADSDEVA